MLERFSYKSEVKVNKSGRFAPSLVEKIEERAKMFEMNFSQTLEELSDIGVSVTSPEIYSYFKKRSLIERKSYGRVVLDFIKSHLYEIDEKRNETSEDNVKKN